MPTVTTRVFMNGNSQAVCIPQDFRLNTQQVEISRPAQGDLLIHPLPVDRGAALLNALHAFDEEFAAVLEEDRSMPITVQERDPL